MLRAGVAAFQAESATIAARGQQPLVVVLLERDREGRTISTLIRLVALQPAVMH
jgi:hypothetical protein